MSMNMFAKRLNAAKARRDFTSKRRSRNSGSVKTWERR